MDWTYLGDKQRGQQALSLPRSSSVWWQTLLDSRPVGPTGRYVWKGQRLVLSFMTAPQFLLHPPTLCSDGVEGMGQNCFCSRVGKRGARISYGGGNGPPCPGSHGEGIFRLWVMFLTGS